jgi:hypothetical protein
MPIGSVGQDPGYPDYVENILFEDVTLIDSNNGGWIKAWQGTPTTMDANGDNGGGGGGWAKNVTFRNFKLHNVALPMYITECIYGGDPSVCDTSQVRIPRRYLLNPQKIKQAFADFCTVPNLRHHLGELHWNIQIRHHRLPPLRQSGPLSRAEVY